MTATTRDWPLAGDPDASVGARHHRVPRFHLERFANNGLQIATVDRRTGARRVAAIRETAVERDFYTAINTDGQKDGKTEHLLTHIEGNAARAIRNILNPVFRLFPPQPQDRADLCLFLAFQKVRGRLTRKRIELLGDLWAHLHIPGNMTADQAAVWLQANDEDITPESVQDLLELSASMSDLEFIPDPNEHLRVMGDLALRISELLLPRPWWIAEYDAPALLTSDEPVGLHFRDRSCPPGHDRGIAYADEIWFPLDPQRLLILGMPDDPLPEQRVSVSTETARTVNLTVAAGAYEQIYMHPDQDHLERIRLPKPGPILKINGQMPIDFSRHNQPPIDTRTQRRK
ncbi:MAG: DUF4238 domain-containing protein [Streptosporangiaceae bacterium]